jgi:hypothetical protein
LGLEKKEVNTTMQKTKRAPYPTKPARSRGKKGGMNVATGGAIGAVLGGAIGAGAAAALSDKKTRHAVTATATDVAAKAKDYALDAMQEAEIAGDLPNGTTETIEKTTKQPQK